MENYKGKTKEDLIKEIQKLKKTNNKKDSNSLIQELKKSKEQLKLSEESIKISEKKFTSLTENMTDLIVSMSPKGEIVNINSAIENFSGYNAEEEIGNHISKFFYKKIELDRALKLLAEVLITHESGTFEFLFKPKGAKPFWVELSYVPVIKSGKAYEIQMFLRDISERKNAEEKLKTSNKLLKTREKEIKKYAEDLNKKVKELSCLFGINESIRVKSTIDKILQDTVYLIPKGLPFPSIVHAKIQYKDREFFSHSFLETKWKISADIVVKGDVKGLIEVYYIKESADKIAPLNEEIKFLNGIAKTISEAITHKHTDAEITKYRIASDKALHGNAIVDTNGNISYINEYFAQSHGYSTQELIGENLSIFHSKEQMEEVNKINDLLKKEGSYSHKEVWHTHKNGTAFPMLMSGIIIYNRDGKILHLASSAIDITEQKKKEEELLKLNAAFKQSPSIINITDTNGILEYANPKFTEVTGYTLEETLGKHIKFMESGELPNEVYEDLWKTISSGKIWNGEFHNKKKNGERYWEQASISPVLNEEEKIINYIKMGEDVTEKKRAEEVKKVKYKISNAVFKTKDIEDFINVVRNIINPIINTQNFYLSLYDKETEKFLLIFHRDGNDEPNYLSAVKTLSSYVIKTKKPLMATKSSKNKLIKSGDINLIDSKSKIWLGVPLFKKDNICGVYSVQSYENEKAFDTSDIKTLEEIAPQLSISIEHKRAWDKVRNDLIKYMKKSES
jgi:PAS domain S-box-containing protein